jgi:hypothetical protein
MVDGRSATTFVLAARLPWSENVPDPDGGSLDMAAIYECGFRRDCSIRNISALGATLRGEVTSTPGDEVAVELEAGQRPAGTIAWVSGTDLGVAFKQPVDVVALIKRNLVSQPAERRRMPRIEIRCSAWLNDGREFWEAVVRNISGGGLQVEGEELPVAGAQIALFVEGLNVPPGEVIWRKGNLAGIEFRQELGWASVLPWIRNLVIDRGQ